MWNQLFKIIESSGPVFGLMAMFTLVGNALGWWVWGYVHRREIEHRESETERVVKERDFWLEKALDAIGVGEEVAEVALNLAQETT